MPFQVLKVVTPADWRTGTPAVYEDITAQYPANKKYGKRHSPLMRVARPPRETLRTVSTGYDARRAVEYVSLMTGKTGKPILADYVVHGEKFPRVRAVKFRSGETYTIPNWDWNGHNQTLEQCEITP